jgi:TonB family protein
VRLTQFFPGLGALALAGCSTLFNPPGLELPFVAQPADFAVPESLATSSQWVDGEVLFAALIDESGVLHDWIIAGASHAELEAIAERALRETSFMPARFRGRAVPAQVAIKFSFGEDEPRINTFEIDSLGITSSSPWEGHRPTTKLRIFQADELDSAPRLIHDVRPESTGGSGSVKVQFVIDPEGAVRLPGIVSSNDPQLSAAVLNAVTGWRFTIPHRHGEPVSALVRQEIRFGQIDR